MDSFGLGRKYVVCVGWEIKSPKWVKFYSEQGVTLKPLPFIHISFWIFIYYTINLTSYETRNKITRYMTKPQRQDIPTKSLKLFYTYVVQYYQ